VCNRRGNDKRVYGRVYGFYAKRLNDGVSFRVFYASILLFEVEWRLILVKKLLLFLHKSFYL
jgi:hypothetical protein